MSSDSRDALIRLLADGEWHSGPALAGTLACTRSAVWKQLHKLPEFGLSLESAPGKGYRLSAPLDLLDGTRLRKALATGVADSCESLTIDTVLDSTSDRVKSLGLPPEGRWHAALAEFQTGGRGRRGRTWMSPLGSGLCLSVGWGYDGLPAGFSALGLAMGLAVRQALADAGARGLLVKWPNDIVAGDRKLAGLLIEVEGESTGPAMVVVGVGINMAVDEALGDRVAREGGLEPVGLRELSGAEPITRSLLAARVLDELVENLAAFATRGLAGLADRWRPHDALAGRRVTVHSGSRTVRGTARGIADDGALLLETIDGIRPLFAGDVSLRARA